MLIPRRILILSLILVSWFLISSSCGTKTEHHNIVVIGGGLMGSSTAWHLAHAGEQILLLEKQDSVYNSGSSLGDARIARSFGGKNDKWSFLHNRTVAQVKQLIKFLNKTDDSNHSIDEIYHTSPVSYIRNKSRLASVQQQINEQSDSIQIAITHDEGVKLFNADLADSIFLLREYKPNSGTINPSLIIRKMHRGIELKESKIRYNILVSKLDRDQNGIYNLQLKDTRTGKVSYIKANQVVTSAGPYNGQLLKHVAPYFDQLIDTKRVFVSFFRLKKEVFNTLSLETKDKLLGAYPCINSTAGTREGANFSMIESFDEDGNPLIKIGGHFQRSEIKDLYKVWSQKLSIEEIAWSKKHILRYWNFINLDISPKGLEYENGYSCVYSLSKTEVPYVTPAQINEAKDNTLIVLGAMSGVGAKGCLAYGELAANYLLERDDDNELYQITKNALGYQRLAKDIASLDENR